MTTPSPSAGPTFFTISQATTHLFRDLYIANTMLVLVQSGSKKVRPKQEDPLNVNAGELLIFPSGTFITIENRIISGQDYVAWCASYPDDLILEVFGQGDMTTPLPPVIAIGACPDGLSFMLKRLARLDGDDTLPDSVRHHRSIEPLIWLKSMGVSLPMRREQSLDRRLREHLSSDLERKWRSSDVASSFGMSEATFRRHLHACDTTFSETLMSVRLEHGLTLLQTTTEPISQIALACGFATPSHFSDAFKGRFDIAPKYIRQSAT